MKERYKPGIYIALIMLAMMAILFIGASPRINLNNYHEECYEYQQVQFQRYTQYCNSSYISLVYCNDHHPMCGCPTGKIVTTYYNESVQGNNCLKYILVRDVEGLK